MSTDTKEVLFMSHLQTPKDIHFKKSFLWNTMHSYSELLDKY